MMRCRNQSPWNERYDWDGRAHRDPVSATQHHVGPSVEQGRYDFPGSLEVDAPVAEHANTSSRRDQVGATGTFRYEPG
jgi:hypothetical protein